MSYVETLNETDIAFGRKLWHSLRLKKEFPAQGLLWLFEPQTAEWHLIVASPKVDELGPRDAYRELAEATRDVQASSSQLLKIELISPTQEFYQALRSVLSQTASVEGVRLGNTQVGGMFINDAYLYEIR